MEKGDDFHEGKQCKLTKLSIFIENRCDEDGELL